jgi:hypothetical protein
MASFCHIRTFSREQPSVPDLGNWILFKFPVFLGSMIEPGISPGTSSQGGFMRISIAREALRQAVDVCGKVVNVKAAKEALIPFPP